jgi:hypothetical protein
VQRRSELRLEICTQEFVTGAVKIEARDRPNTELLQKAHKKHDYRLHIILRTCNVVQGTWSFTRFSIALQTRLFLHHSFGHFPKTPGCKSRVRVPLTRLSQPQSGRPARLRYIDGEPITEGNGTPAWRDDWRLWPTSKHAFHRL